MIVSVCSASHDDPLCIVKISRQGKHAPIEEDF